MSPFLTIAFILLHNIYALQQWSIDISNSTQKYFENWWNVGCGSGHASLALRSDYRQLLNTAHTELGFKYVRFHGILMDDVGAVNGINDYSFINIDNIFDFLLSINMKPFVEIGFMPQDFASNTSCTWQHYKGIISPPKDYKIWYSFIANLTSHLVDRYGIDEVSSWYFEVWNGMLSFINHNITWYHLYINEHT